MPAIIDIRELSFRYGDGRPVLDNVSLRVERCETVALIGPNGAGKSTLLLHLNGILPDSKKSDRASEIGVWIDELPVTQANLLAIRRIVGLVFQDPDDQLFCASVTEDVEFGPLQAGLSESEVQRLTREALDRVGLTGLEDRAPQSLSVGQRKRACLAGVLACRPRLLVLDEPTSHLDPRGRREFIDLVMSLAMPKIVATHDLELALEIATRVVVLDGGRIQADGAPHAILSDATLMDRHGLEVPPSLRADLRDVRMPR